MARLTIIAISMISLLGCSPAKQAGNIKVLDFAPFTIDVPENWEKITLRGIDSYIGRISIDEKDSLVFDLGMFSYDLSDEMSESTTEMINGQKAKIVFPRNPGTGITGIYIDSVSGRGTGRTKFNLYGRNLNPENQELVLKAIRTLKFKKQDTNQ